MASRLRAFARSLDPLSFELESTCIEGAIGKGLAGEFLTWVKSLDLPDPEVVLKNPKLVKVPDRPDKAFLLINAAVSAIKGDLTEDRWHKGWELVKVYCDADQPDVAVPAARVLATLARGKNFKMPTNDLVAGLSELMLGQ